MLHRHLNPYKCLIITQLIKSEQSRLYRIFNIQAVIIIICGCIEIFITYICPILCSYLAYLFISIIINIPVFITYAIYLDYIFYILLYLTAFAYTLINSNKIQRYQTYKRKYYKICRSFYYYLHYAPTCRTALQAVYPLIQCICSYIFLRM